MDQAISAWVGLCRASYYVNLLGLKIPLGLLVRASRAKHVLGFITLVWVPFLAYCHISLLPQVQEARYGLAVWHTLAAMWITLPLLVVGSVILSFVRAFQPLALFLGGLLAASCFHVFAIPALIKTWIGSALLQVLFAFFEDAPIACWIWCLIHVVRLQEHVRKHQSDRASPFDERKGSAAPQVLIVGNAPTVIDGPPLGAVMDGFDHVVRFNSYSISKPEYTGSKVGFHFCNGRNFPSSKAVKAVCPLFNASLTHAVYLFMPHLEEAGTIYSTLTSSNVDSWFIAEDQILELRKKIGCRIWQIPTSGMVAINAFLEEHDQVVLHGFNFFEGKKIHYFEESPTQLITSWLERFVTHDPSLEKVWVAGLVKDGYASFLSDSVTQPGASTVQETTPSSRIAGANGSKVSLKERRGKSRGIMETVLKDGMPSQFSI